jgi:Fe-S-cluster containining protein
MREIQNLKEKILKEYPRLTKDDTFSFACHPGVPCFNNCCGDVNIFLTPYDIIRLKQKLGIRSDEFLSKYTISPFDKNLKYPVVMLKMNEDKAKSCPFVREDGCIVYSDRPWACRMYPLGLASPKDGTAELDDDFYFLLEDTICKGFNEPRKWTVRQWIEDQGIVEYDEMGREFKDLTLHDFFQEGNNLTPKKVDMFFMACYNLDRFRDFLFGSTFFERFDIDDEKKKKIGSDDIELLRFGYRWLRFALFGEQTIEVKQEVFDAKKREIETRKK